MSRGRSQEAAGETLEARATFNTVLDIARPIGAIDLCVEAAVAFETAGWLPGLNGLPAVRLLRSVLEIVPEGDSQQRARTLASLGRALNYSGLHDTALEVGTVAIEMARRVGDKRTLAFAISTRLATRSDPTEIHTRIELGNEAVKICEEIGDVDMMANALAWIMNDIMDLGDPRWSEGFYKKWRSRVLKLRDPMWLYNLSTLDAGVATSDGRFEDAEKIAQAGLELGRRLRALDADGVHGAMMFCIRREQGRLHEVRPALELFLKHRPTEIWRPGLALLYAELDMRDEARAEFELLAEHEFAAVSRDALFTCSLAYLTDVCSYLGDVEQAPFLYDALRVYEGHNISQGVANMYIGPAERFMGRLAALMSRWEEAERHFESTLRMAGRMSAPIQVAHCKFLLGEMLQTRSGPGCWTSAK